MSRTQFFEDCECSDNLLIINVLWQVQPFTLPNTASNSLIFEFLFRHSSKTENYTSLNISAEANCFFLRSPLFFSLQRAVFKFSAHSGEISTVLKIKFQCAENVATVRWNFQNLVLFSQELFAGCK